jgi:AcrR family transcriptional regulator
MAKSRGKKPSYHHGDLARALVEAAEEILAESGTEGFTLRECARRAGVSHAAPAHHFGDVRGLLTEVAIRGFERLTKVTNDAGRGNGRPLVRLRSMLEAYVENAMENPVAFRLMFASSRIRHGDARLATASREAYEVLLKAIDDMAVSAGKPKPGAFSPEITLVWSAVHGFASLLVERRLEAGIKIHYGGDWRKRAAATLDLLIELLKERFPSHPDSAGRA